MDLHHPFLHLQSKGMCQHTCTTRASGMRASSSSDDSQSLQYSIISSSSVSSSYGRGANEASSMSYQRLRSSPTAQLELLELDNTEERVVPDKGAKTESLEFHMDSGQRQRVLVERHLRASDLCHVLALKFSVASSGTGWSIVEHWSDLGIERHLEDHEKVLAVYRRSGRVAERIFIFRKDPNKYAFIENPKPYFLSEMVDSSYWQAPPTKDVHLPEPATPQARLAGMSGGKSTPGLVLSAVWLRERVPRQGVPWIKAFLLLCEDKLYVCHNLQTLVRFVREWQCWDANKDNARSASKEDCTGAEAPGATNLVPLLAGSEVEEFASLAEYDVYTTLNARNQLRAPTEFGLCLRPTSPLLPVRRVCNAMDFLCFAVESERTRLCWLTAMRIVKLKSLVRDGYYNYDHHGSDEELAKKLWWDVPSTSKQDNSAAAELISENERARVAMDFTGSVGRIVDDPREAREVARDGSLCWLQQRWKPSAPMCVGVGSRPSSEPERIVQMPWYVGQASRERALQLLMQPHLQPGAFLVRESTKAMGMPVLSLRTPEDSVVHIQIQRVHDAERGLIWSLDGGHTKFFSLDHLVEFYELNQGNLPTSLSHFPDLS